ncbi:hypothetical protein SCP_0100510 [Sparassis crispa]|uniref:Cleavage/polyadenylation specificity factor A subunit N-terminal domain-containing protein n=1 Tax=Sparassis crispa TaxID=139825 RepID=A0A401G4V3_9APHY|nr:hypothetical protein SCP_0100510 [Sparassis crispa]GBE77179.1 hypothetical protein SCP_0100510 [Sparassis crispa]
MVLLPGARYLVASVTDDAGLNYAVVVFSVDRTSLGAVPLAKTLTLTKAYNLRAKYMTVHGESGIVVAFDREMRGNESWKCFDASKRDTNGGAKPKSPFKYECVLLHVSLSSLEALIRARVVPGSREYLLYASTRPRPFQNLATVMSRKPIGAPSLGEIFGSPYVAVSEDCSNIVFKNLDGGNASVLTCVPTVLGSDEAHSIEAIHLVSERNQVLVVRKIKIERGSPALAIEYFDVLSEPGGPRAHTDSIYLYCKDVASVKISDNDSYARNGLSQSILSTPISVFIRTTDEGSLAYLRIFPQRKEHGLAAAPTSPSFDLARRPSFSTEVYPLQDGAQLQQLSWEDEHVGVLPASCRPVVYLIDKNDPDASPHILRYMRLRDFDPESTSKQAAHDGGDLEDNSGETARMMTTQLVIPAKVANLASVSALAWDETTGRLCIADARTGMVQVLDFAALPLS